MNVKIFRETKSATQSGRVRDGQWLLQYELETPRRPEPLMGWTASGDTLNQVTLRFNTSDDAVAFATKKGWQYTVSTAHERRVTPRNYVDNFKYRPVKAPDHSKAS